MSRSLGNTSPVFSNSDKIEASEIFTAKEMRNSYLVKRGVYVK